MLCGIGLANHILEFLSIVFLFFVLLLIGGDAGEWLYKGLNVIWLYALAAANSLLGFVGIVFICLVDLFYPFSEPGISKKRADRLQKMIFFEILSKKMRQT